MKEKRDQRFGIMLSESERVGLRDLAEAEGISESDVLRQLLRGALHEMEERQRSTAASIAASESYPLQRPKNSRMVQPSRR